MCSMGKVSPRDNLILKDPVVAGLALLVRFWLPGARLVKLTC
jgi:hypothetical protein